MTLACSVGLVNHRLHDSPPGIDEPVEEQEISSDVDVRVADSQSIYGTPEIIFEVEDQGGGGDTRHYLTCISSILHRQFCCQIQ